MFTLNPAPKANWESDVKACNDCQKAFGLTRKKHHCRYCAKTFCGKCSSKNAVLPLLSCSSCATKATSTGSGKTVAIFGATGATGGVTASRAIALGFNVRLCCRSQAKLFTKIPESKDNEKVTVIESNLDAESIAKTIAGADTVICILGHTPNGPVDIIASTTTLVLAEARKIPEADRPVCIFQSGNAVPWEGDTDHFNGGKAVLKLTANDKVFGPMIADIIQAAEVMKQTTDVKWIAARCSRMTDGKATGDYVTTKLIASTGLGTASNTIASSISRVNAADFYMRVAADPALAQSYCHCGPVLQNKINPHADRRVYKTTEDDTQWTGGQGDAWRASSAVVNMDLSGKTYLVTGGTIGGIGWTLIDHLAKQGARVGLLGRSQKKADDAIAKMKEPKNAGPDAKVHYFACDLGDLASVRACAAAVDAQFDRIDGLVCNAGIMDVPQGKTVDGYERQFATNHLGHFLLINLLLDKIKASAPSRVVITASAAHCPHDFAPKLPMPAMDFDDLQWETREYHPEAAYMASKLANVLCAVQLQKMMDEEKVDVNVTSHHPGWVGSNLVAGGGMPPWFQNHVVAKFMPVLDTWDGCQTTLHCLLDPSCKENGGAFYSQTGPYSDKKLKNGGWPMVSPNPQVHDPAVWQQLWDVSLKLVGL